MKILVLYDQYSTHTNTVYEHLLSFNAHSIHDHFFCHCGGSAKIINWDQFDVVVIHYSARLVTHAVSKSMFSGIKAFPGIKVLFVQDEYDLTERLRQAIINLAINVVYTCVPTKSIEAIYPASRFRNTKFINTLTGYVSSGVEHRRDWLPLGKRSVDVGYRGRALPFWYGDLGQEKQEIAEQFKQKCEQRGIVCDIEWNDKHRIYGDAWNSFLGNCRATLGTESGSNVFDDFGYLRAKFSEFKHKFPNSTYQEARQFVFGSKVEEPVMNQISPRIFESILAKTGLILYEGNYSGVIYPDVHYISLKKDFSNFDDVMAKLTDNRFMGDMVDRAYRDVIESGRFSYSMFFLEYDKTIGMLFSGGASKMLQVVPNRQITVQPLRTENLSLPPVLALCWRAIPISIRTHIGPIIRKVLSSGRTIK